MKTKRLLLVAILAATILLAAIILTACDEEKPEPHNHTFSVFWSWNDSEHWHDAICGHDLRSDVALHIGDGDNCEICGYSFTQGVIYTLSNDGQSYYVSKSKNATGNVVIFSYYKGLPVTRISNNAFEYCSSLTSITIPSSVTSIGESAFFNCYNLQTVAFEEDSQLQSIGNRAFGSCESLTSITIPSGVTNMGYEVFRGCSDLTSISISSSVTSIGNSAFAGCSSLTSIIIPSSVTIIGEYAFSGCSGLQTVIFEGDSQLQSIGRWAFSSCSSLPSITIPRNVTSIGMNAFRNCSGLQSITFENPYGWRSDGIFSFGGSLLSLTDPIQNAWFFTAFDFEWTRS